MNGIAAPVSPSQTSLGRKDHFRARYWNSRRASATLIVTGARPRRLSRRGLDHERSARVFAVTRNSANITISATAIGPVFMREPTGRAVFSVGNVDIAALGHYTVGIRRPSFAVLLRVSLDYGSTRHCRPERSRALPAATRGSGHKQAVQFALVVTINGIDRILLLSVRNIFLIWVYLLLFRGMFWRIRSLLQKASGPGRTRSRCRRIPRRDGAMS